MWTELPVIVAVPRLSVRHSSTRATAAAGRTPVGIHSGSCETAKNVPENMYSGMMTKRNTVSMWRSLRTPTAHAAAGAANATPASVAPNRAPRAHHPPINPNAAITTMKARWR